MIYYYFKNNELNKIEKKKIFQHSERCLIHHYEFENNDGIAFGVFKGNSSLNKFMSSNDWQMILDCLKDPIKIYKKTPNVKPTSKKFTLNNLNIEFETSWFDLDVEFYGKLLRSVNMSLAYPFLIFIKVCMRSNIDGFVCAPSPVSNESNNPRSNDLLNDMKTCRVVLTKINSIDELKETSQEKKRKLSYIDDDIHGVPLKSTPSSSTPFIRKSIEKMSSIENDVSQIISLDESCKERIRCTGDNKLELSKMQKRLFNPMVTTPLSANRSNKIKIRSRRKIRLSTTQLLNNTKKLKRKKVTKQVKKVKRKKVSTISITLEETNKDKENHKPIDNVADTEEW